MFDKTSDIFDKVEEGFKNIKTWFTNLTTDIGNFFKDLGENIGSWFTNLVEQTYQNTVSIGNWFSNLGTDIGNWFSNLGTNIGNFFNNLWNNISTLPDTIWNLFKEGLSWLFIPEDNYFDNKIEQIKTALNEKIPYQQYVDSLKDIESITDLMGDTDEITTSIDLKNYSILDKFTLSMNKFIDFSIFSNYKNTWYSWVRVVVYIGLVIYNINQTVKMFNGFSAIDGSIRDVSNNLSRGSDKK